MVPDLDSAPKDLKKFNNPSLTLQHAGNTGVLSFEREDESLVP